MRRRRRRDGAGEAPVSPEPGEPVLVSRHDDPERERRATRRIALLLVLSAAAGIGLLVLYALGGQVQLEGVLVGVALGAMGFALVLWGKHLFTHEVVTEDREPHESEAGERRIAEDLIAESETGITRRRLLTRLLVGAAGAFGLALIFPIRSLGPSPGNSLFVTSWRRGKRLVDDTGQPVRVDTLPESGVVTVFPEGRVGDANAQAILVRVPEDILHLPDRPRGLGPGRERLLLEALHARRVPGRAVPGELPPAAVPVPPVGVRRDGRGVGGVRAGRAAAAAAADRGRRGRVPRGAGRLQRAGRAGVLGPGRGTGSRDRPGRMFGWFDERLGAASFARRTLNKVFPDHWSFMLGEIALYCFVVLILTGVFLTFFYVPDAKEVVYHGPLRAAAGRRPSRGRTTRCCACRSRSAPGSCSARSTTGRRWSWSGASSRTPRGCSSRGRSAARATSTGCSASLLLLLTIAIGFAGYSLPDDLLSGTGLRIAYSVVLSIPSSGRGSRSCCSAGSIRRRTSSTGCSCCT